MSYTPQQLAAIRAAGRAILDAVRAAGDLGAPAGIVYAALMPGCDPTLLPLDQAH